MTSTLATIAQDVKAQVEFNPATVSEYRLIGYEDRLLKREDFNNDKVDAGDIGAGHTVTVLYELTPKGAAPSSDPLRYAGNVRQAAPAARFAGELGFLKLRYKLPGQKQSRLIGMPIPKNIERPMDKADPGFRLAAAVAGFGGLLRGSPWLGAWGWQQDEMLAGQDTLAANDPAAPYRTELVQLIGLAQALSAKGGSAAPAGK
jgi:Ca-activated chloride channel family protein